MMEKIGKSLPWVLIAGLMVGNVLLLRQNLAMRADLNKLKPNALQEGDKVTAFSALDRMSRPVQISFTGKESTRVLLYFAPACPYCQDQFVYWRQVLERTNQNKYQVVGAVSESEDQTKLADYLSAMGCEAMQVVLLSPEVRRQYKLSMTPITLVIDNDGSVKHSWVGRWDDRMIAEASDLFGFRFDKTL